MAFEAGQLETRQTNRRFGLLGSVDRGDPLELDVAELIAHMREAIRMPVEIDDIDVFMKGALRFS